jgi:hypothetical protein
MANLSPSTVRFIHGAAKAFGDDREKIFSMLWRLRSTDNSEPEVRAMIDDYFDDIPAALTLAYESQLAEKDEEIARLKAPLVEHALGADSSGGASIAMIERIESSLVAAVTRNREKISKTSNLSAVGLDLFPWFGYVNLIGRSDATEKGEDGYHRPDHWGGFWIEAQNGELKEFDWLVEYMKEVYARDDFKDHSLRWRWDQWLRVCAAFAMIGSENIATLEKLHLLELRHPDLPRQLCESFYVVPYDSSAMDSCGYNFVAHACALRVASGGATSAGHLDQLYGSAAIPLGG